MKWYVGWYAKGFSCLFIPTPHDSNIISIQRAVKIYSDTNYGSKDIVNKEQLSSVKAEQEW